jgi:hypothetical protein
MQNGENFSSLLGVVVMSNLQVSRHWIDGGRARIGTTHIALQAGQEQPERREM